jgi:hypothetical protein
MHRHFEIVFPQLLKIIKFYQRDRNVQELELEKMEFQLNLEKLKIEKGQTSSKVSDSNAKYKGPKVPKFEEGQDIYS